MAVIAWTPAIRNLPGNCPLPGTSCMTIAKLCVRWRNERSMRHAGPETWRWLDPVVINAVHDPQPAEQGGSEGARDVGELTTHTPAESTLRRVKRQMQLISPPRTPAALRKTMASL